MIIIGYPGIGKTTLAGTNDCIDLESGNFWHNGNRPDNWYVYYCNIAMDLSKQGYTVFVSSHNAVVTRLMKKCTESVYVIYPDIELKDKWVEKLKTRYENSKLEKDLKAWNHVEEHYDSDITNLMKLQIMSVSINNIEEYDLAREIRILQRINKEKSNRKS